MAGPTPVSALIHAATMVAAGVYLLVRTHALLAAAPTVLLVTAWIGVLTAVLSALASLQQTNFKRGIAYSTLSQLGYMFAGVGFGAAFPAFFHLVTHASFKALLFLTAGVVIHALGGEERLANLRGMQRVAALQPARWCFLIGSLALIGVPIVTSGAFSKDGILEAGLHSQPLLGAVLVGTVFLTGLYSGRLFFIVFDGPREGSEPHAPSPLMIWPLVPLAIGAILLGYVEFPAHGLSGLVGPAVAEAELVGLISPVGLVAAVLGLAVLAAVHDLQLAALYCDRVVLLSAGEIVSQGPPEVVLTAPLLHAAFGQRVVLSPHPTHGVPLVALVPNGNARRLSPEETPRA
jgi:NADH-quinone oxidoreductase subunit L